MSKNIKPHVVGNGITSIVGEVSKPREMNRLLEALDYFQSLCIREDDEDIGYLYGTYIPYVENCEYKKQFTMLKDFITNMPDLDVKFIKNFIPLDEPHCSACMYYTESDCTKEIVGKCRLENLQALIDYLKGE
ncbi:hypothetical protein [PinkBerry-associated phage LS06-2018-MD08]|nr:hypothetical protein [PinkBerry-associated phage LS06-2018-MD08]